MSRAVSLSGASALALFAFVTAARADTRTWTGGGADDRWSTPANWSGNAVPDADGVALFDGTSSKDCVVDGDVEVGVIEIKPEYTGTVTQAAGVTLTVNSEWKQDGGSFAGADGTVTVCGPFTMKRGSFAVGSGAMTVAGELKIEETASFNAGSGALDVAGPLTLLDGTFNAAGSTVTVAGEFKQDGGMLEAGEAALDLKGRLTLSGGTLSPGTATFKFIGGAEQVADFASAPAFAAVSVEKTGGVLRFVKKGFSAGVMSIAPGNTVYFTSEDATTLGRTAWYGMPGELIVLRSVDEGEHWPLVVSSQQVVTWVDVRDSDASGGSGIMAYNSVDRGNDLNWAFGDDYAGPDLSVVSPAAGTWTNEPKPQIAASVVNGLSGVDPATVTMQVLATGVPAQYDGASGQVTYTPLDGLPEQTITVVVEAADFARNSSRLEWEFHMDYTPPDVTVCEPAAVSWINDATPVIAATATDAGSGIDMAETTMQVPGQSVTPSYDEPNDRVFHQQTQVLGEGSVAVSMVVADVAGNSAPLSWSFTVDTIPPRVASTSPADGATHAAAGIPYVAVTFNEIVVAESVESGFSFFANDAPGGGTFVWAQSGTEVRFTPTSPVTDGNGYYVVLAGDTIRDRAGNLLDGNANGAAEGSPDDDGIFGFSTASNNLANLARRVYEDGAWTFVPTTIVPAITNAREDALPRIAESEFALYGEAVAPGDGSTPMAKVYMSDADDEPVGAVIEVPCTPLYVHHRVCVKKVLLKRYYVYYYFYRSAKPLVVVKSEDIEEGDRGDFVVLRAVPSAKLTIIVHVPAEYAP